MLYTEGMAVLPEFFRGITYFEWDEGNAAKSWTKHAVTQPEAEQGFFNRPILVTDDQAHSVEERRHFALGVTDYGRPLLIVFTLRPPALRVISARPMRRRERLIYEKAEAE